MERSSYQWKRSRRSESDPALSTSLAFLLAIFFFPIGVWAQEHLKGRVEDEKGDAIAGAVVRFISESAQTAVTASTNTEGRFQLDLTTIENGKLVIEATGFRPTERK